MATSGTATFSRTRDQFIGRALRICNAFEAGETPDDQSVQDAAAALNSMVKHWQASGIHIWRTTEATLFLQAAQSRYTIATDSSDHASESFTETTLTAAALDGATTITVASISGISSTYYIGVQVDDGTIHWTTVNGAPSGSTVTLTAALDDSAANGSSVFVYQTKLVRPLRIISARRYNFIDDIETPISEYDRVEYQELPNKSSTGEVAGFYYNRRGGANSSGLLYVWPVPSAVEGALKLTVARPIEDFSAAGNTSDLPQEWIQAIEWNLADQIADEYGVPDPLRTRIERRAAQYLAEVNWNERELLSFEFVPE